jgi:hypothetical protein
LWISFFKLFTHGSFSYDSFIHNKTVKQMNKKESAHDRAKMTKVAARRMAANGVKKAIGNAVRQRKSEQAFNRFLQSVLVVTEGESFPRRPK